MSHSCPTRVPLMFHITHLCFQTRFCHKSAFANTSLWQNRVFKQHACWIVRSRILDRAIHGIVPRFSIIGIVPRVFTMTARFFTLTGRFFLLSDDRTDGFSLSFDDRTGFFSVIRWQGCSLHCHSMTALLNAYCHQMTARMDLRQSCNARGRLTLCIYQVHRWVILKKMT